MARRELLAVSPAIRANARRGRHSRLARCTWPASGPTDTFLLLLGRAVLVSRRPLARTAQRRSAGRAGHRRHGQRRSAARRKSPAARRKSLGRRGGRGARLGPGAAANGRLARLPPDRQAVCRHQGRAKRHSRTGRQAGSVAAQGDFRHAPRPASRCWCSRRCTWAAW